LSVHPEPAAPHGSAPSKTPRTSPRR
jgi:hypothetical protein